MAGISRFRVPATRLAKRLKRWTETVGESPEEFLASLSLWAKSDYESHWMRELKVLLEGNPKVALVVSYYGNPASNMQIWRAYRDGEWVHFQNQILWYR